MDFNTNKTQGNSTSNQANQASNQGRIQPTQQANQGFDKSTKCDKTQLQNPEEQPNSTKPLDKVQEQKEDDNTCTIGTILNEIDEEERLHEQLASNKYAKVCRYDEGHIYQQAFSCSTCHEEKLKLAVPDQKQRLEIYYKATGEQDEDGQPVFLLNNLKLIEDSEKLGIKPFGFCLGCMLHCHEGHEIHELYHKLDFRCDCGNSRMPYACNLNNEGKQYENLDNFYNDTFFDIYCYCRQRHEDGEMDKYMIQCYNCEDWFHNQHLNPQQTQEEISEKYMLICSKCIQKMSVSNKLHLYEDFFHESLQSLFMNTRRNQDCNQADLNSNSTKRRKIDDSGKDKKIRNCSQLETTEVSIDKKENEVGLSSQNIDFIIDESFLEVLCECQNCAKAFSKIKRMVNQIANLNEDEKNLDNNLEGIVNEDESTKNTTDQVPNGGKVSKDQIFSEEHIMYTMQKIMLEKSKSMPHEAQIYIAENMGLFKDKLRTFFKKFENTGTAVRPEDIRQFFSEMDELRRVTLAEHLSISRNPK